MSEYLKTRASFDSRYRLSKVRIDDFILPGKRRYETWIAPDIDIDDYDSILVTSAEHMRIDLIAWRAYRDCSLWWAIALVNNIGNAFASIPPGTILKIPKIEAINKIFSRIIVE